MIGAKGFQVELKLIAFKVEEQDGGGVNGGIFNVLRK